MQIKGDENVDFNYYYKYIYRDNQFISAFEFITQGVANFFITKTATEKEEKFEKEIGKIYESLTEIYDSLYPNGSFYMGDIGVESRPNMIPETMQASFPIKFNIASTARRNDRSMYTHRNLDVTGHNTTAEKRLNNTR